MLPRTATLASTRLFAALGAAALLTTALGACVTEAESLLIIGKDSSNGSGGDASAGVGGFDPGDSSGAGGVQACAGVENEATKIPVSMFIAVDKSGSMDDDNKWNNAKSAFLKFFADPAADSLNVALRFWPDQGCDSASCNVDACATPQVELGTLADPAHEAALTQLFNSKDPGGPTPMEAALAGAAKWAVTHQTTVGSAEKVVVVLVTDGEPNGCDEGINAISQHAANAFAEKEILTFAVGMDGSNEAQMDTIAKAGMSEKGFFIGNGNAEADLLLALKKIQASIVACTYTMPESPAPDQVIDPAQVNLSYTPGDGSASTDFKQVASEGACGGAEDAWYYDDPNEPTSIHLCPAACTKVQGDEAAKIKLVLGCATKVS